MTRWQKFPRIAAARCLGWASLLALAFASPLLMSWLARPERGPASGSVGRSDDGDPHAFFRELRPPQGVPKHVHLMHLDGFRPDLFKRLFDYGQLPHFKFLFERGRISYEASTVDKSETMKVIESYLTSRRDTFIAGWWQFNRSSFQYKNYWLDPAEVINYALGLEFPLYPNLFDFLSAKGQTVASGFGLHRRGVPFVNYSRAYIEGAQAVFKHTYLDQVHATMDGTRRVYERIARTRGRIPALSTSLLAAADEFSHLEGVKRADHDRFHYGDEACFDRGVDPRMTALFERIEQDDREGGKHGVARHFTRVVRSQRGAPMQLCLVVPRIEVHAEPVRGGATSIGPGREELAAPRYALGMIAIDIELGYLIDTLRSIRFDQAGKPQFDPAWGNGLAAYVSAGHAEGSLFENTLFALMGDHGMADTRRMMVPVKKEHPDPNRDPRSLDVTFIESLNQALGLATGDKTRESGEDDLLGVDDALQPLRIAFPHKSKEWQTPAIRRLTQEAERWSAAFVDELKNLIKNQEQRKRWWLLFLKAALVNPKVDEAFEPYDERVRDILAALYLKGDPRYVKAELADNREVYARQVRLVYGGGARNNAELFLPSFRSGTRDRRATWELRPSFEEILEYRPAGPRGRKLLDVLRAHPGVGLMFIREQNGDIPDSYDPRDGRMEIAVLDRSGNRSTISVERDRATGELIYGYRVEDDSPRDPLGYDELPRGRWTHGTYAEWNDRSVLARHYYHNAVAGMGSYLYSNNPAIGDLTLMHAQGWNFGDNAGGHGGLHSEEKLTVMMLSGPRIIRGGLMAHARYKALPDGSGVREEPWRAYPTVVDMAPTILHWLGYGEGALSGFARDGGFERQFRKWTAGQREEIIGNLDRVEGLEAAIREMGLNIRPSQFTPRLKRLLQFMPTTIPRLPDYRGFREDGNLLEH